MGVSYTHTHTHTHTHIMFLLLVQLKTKKMNKPKQENGQFKMETQERLPLKLLTVVA